VAWSSRKDPGAVILGVPCLLAWTALAGGAHGIVLPGICGPASFWSAPVPAALDLAVLLNPPDRLAGSWALMAVAMMAPLIGAPLRQLRERSLARLRSAAMLCFALGYGGVWMAAGGIVLGTALGFALLLPPGWSAAGAGLLVLLWQVSPTKQHCLNRCHARPRIAAFGAPAAASALRYGLTHGRWCVAASAPLMVLPFLLPAGHLAAMAAVAVFLYAERIERPAPPRWGWRGTTIAWRLTLYKAAALAPAAGTNRVA